MATVKAIHPAFQKPVYTFRRKVFRLFGGFFQIYDETGTQILHSEQASFRLKEDFTVYETATNIPLLRIKTPQILDLGATYYVTDVKSMEEVGSLRRKFLKSLFKDEWALISPDGMEIGKLTEQSVIGALLSRFIDLWPQTYTINLLDGTPVTRIKQHFNPFILKYTMTVFDYGDEIDPRLMVAAGILMAAIERRQNNSNFSIDV